MNYSRDAAGTTCLSGQDPLWVHLGQTEWCSLDSWSASSTVTFTRGPLSVCIRAVMTCDERRQKSPAAESLTYKNASWTSGLLIYDMQAL